MAMRNSSGQSLCVILPILVVIFLSGCQARQPANVTPTATILLSPTLTASPASLVSATQTPAPTSTIQPEPTLTRYILTAVLNYDTHRIVVDEVIHFTNNTSQTLSELPLMVDALYYPGVFNLNSISMGEPATSVSYTIETGQIRLMLPSQLNPGETITLALAFELNLPSPVPSAETRPIPFGYSAMQTNLVDWYPFIPPYHATKGWLANRAGFFGEHLVYDIADFEVHLKVESMMSGLEIAASAPAQKDEQGWIHYTYPEARNFVFSVSSEYEILSATVDGVTVYSYSFPFQSTAAQAALDATVKSIALFNRIYPPYPRPILSLVQAGFRDGMEYDGLYFLSGDFYNLYNGAPDQYLIAIAAHETAHQWFYGMVGNDQAIEPWLDEALCTFHELLFYEKYFPGAVNWWWNYRVKFFNPHGWIDSNIYNSQGYEAYRNAIYLNGAIFLDELSTAMGREQFTSFIRTYLQTYTGQIASTQDFLMLAKTMGAPSQKDFYANYFQNYADFDH